MRSRAAQSANHLVCLVAPAPGVAAVHTYDSFDGASRNASKWTTVQQGAGPTYDQADGELRIAIPSNSTETGAGVFNAGYESVCSLHGSFDLEVDYHLLTWPAWNGVRVGISAGSFGVQRTSGYDEIYAVDANGSVTSTSTLDTSGKLRIVRDGTTTSGYYWSNGSWVEIAQANLGDDDVPFNLSAWSHNWAFAHQNVDVSFDNVALQGILRCPQVYDNFNDVGLDASKWTERLIGAGPSTTIDSGELHASLSDAASETGDGVFSAGVRSVCRATGDFDLETDFGLDAWPTSNGVRAGLSMGNLSVHRDYDLGYEQYVADLNSSITRVQTSDQTGRLRLVRSGGRASAYFWKDGGWNLIASSSVPVVDSAFDVAIWSHDAFFGHHLTTVAFDNVKFSGSWACAEGTNAALLAKYRPDYRFSPDEPYRPASAALATDTYIPSDHSNTLQSGDNLTIGAADPSQYSYMSPAPPLLSLGSLNSAPADAFIDEGHGNGSDQAADSQQDYTYMIANRPGEYDDRVYGRVVRDSVTGETFLQYWVYYYYNQKTFVGSGDHEGDWELTQVHLDGAGAPFSATYAAHGGPEKCGWADVALDGTHPVVWVADGSHASYFWAGTHPLESGQSDTTAAADDYVETDPTTIVDVTNSPGWIVWAGRWGASTGIPTFGGESPPSPGAQNSWDAESWEPVQSNCSEHTMNRRINRSNATRAVPQATRRPAPDLPRFTVTRTNRTVILRYCFANMPSDLARRPWRLYLSVDNAHDRVPPQTLGWPVTKRCNTIRQRFMYISPPFVIRVKVRNRFGDVSPTRVVKLS